MDVPVLAHQQELIYISSARIQDVVYRTCQEWRMTGTDEERERERERERENQRNPCCQYDLMMKLLYIFTYKSGCFIHLDFHNYIYKTSWKFDLTLEHTNMYICITIIIMSRYQLGYLWPSLATLPIVHCIRQVFRATPRIYTELLYVGWAGRPAFARSYEGVHRSTSLMSSSLLLQQCPACLVRLILIVFVMGGRWPYSFWFVQYCSQHSCVAAVKFLS